MEHLGHSIKTRQMSQLSNRANLALEQYFSALLFIDTATSKMSLALCYKTA